MLSYNPDRQNLGDPKKYAWNWRAVDTNDVHIIANGLLTYAISPIVFAKGHRAKSNFISAEWLGLDFDEGPSMEEMTNNLCDHIMIVGTTKSHQIWKDDKPPCDRFRILLKLPITITKAADYEATARHYVKRYEADDVCIDAARFFWPCTKITALESEGEYADIIEAKEPKRSTFNYKAYRRVRGIPLWVEKWLKEGCADGERSITFFKVAIHLTKCGFTREEIINMAHNSPIPNPNKPADEVYREMVKNIDSGISRGLRDLQEERTPSREKGALS